MTAFVALSFTMVANPASAAKKEKIVARIERKCGLPKGTLTVIGNEITLQPSVDAPYRKIGCIISRLQSAKLDFGFVGNAPDPTAKLQYTARYLAEGRGEQITLLTAALQEHGWIVVRLATAKDGINFLEFASPPEETEGGLERLMRRIQEKEFGDIALGIPPRKLSEGPPLEE